MEFDLGGEWSFHEVGSSEWLKGTVPGCNYTDLLANGKIEDPFIGLNEKKAFWVSERTWEYTREFTLPEDIMNSDKIILECDMIDTLGEVYVNDRLLGRPNNAHMSYSYDITDIVCKLTNKIRIKLLSPIEYLENAQEGDPMPHNFNGVSGVPHMRKPQCHMGWDWGPILPLSGILRGIRVVGYNDARINDILITQKHLSDKVALDIVLEHEVFANAPIEFRYTVSEPDGKTTVKTVKDNKVSLDIKSPKLWWPNDISDEHPLYQVTAEIVVGGESVHAVTKRIGLRTITIDRSADEYGTNFRFIVNGLPIFAKGANWIPNDSFINRFDNKKLKYMIDAVKRANMNMIRVWGGGYYESDEFYDACDEAGILVWQDFCFACAPYPFYNEDFMTNVKEEIACNVKRLRHHASLALWCGNNEIEIMTAGWMNKRKLIEWEEKFFYTVLPSELRKYDSVTEFIEGSPISGKGFRKKTNSDNFGDTHLWAVWHGLQPLNYYRKRYTRFCSEFGLESLCDMRTIEEFAEPKDYSLKSDVFMAHQKCGSGNSKMLFYMSTKYRTPMNFDDIVYLSQLIQLECVKDATEHWRRNRGRCNGSLYWQLNDCWPVTSWASIDYNGRYKALQYGARHFNAPLTISLEDKKGKIKLHIINDHADIFKGAIQYKLIGFDGEVHDSGKYYAEIDGASAKETKTLDYRKLKGMKNLKDKVFVAELLDADNNVIARKTCLFYPEKNTKLVDPELTYSVEVKKGIAYITVSAKKFARSVMISVEGSCAPQSDNFFDILPNESITVTMPSEGMTADAIQKRLKLKSIATVEAKGTAFSDFMLRASVFVKPLNFANWIYYMTT